jgi:hypothetical protein
MVLGVPSVSKAVFTVELTDGTNYITIDQTGAIVSSSGATSGTITTTASGTSALQINDSSINIGSIIISNFSASELIQGIGSPASPVTGVYDTSLTASSSNTAVLKVYSSDTAFLATATSQLRSVSSLTDQDTVTDPNFSMSTTTWLNGTKSGNAAFFSGGQFSVPAGSISVSGDTNGTLSTGGTGGADSSSNLINLSPGLFSLANAFTVNFLTAGTGVTATTQSTFTNGGRPPNTSTPAPASVLLAVAGIPVFGLMWIVRRRRSKDESATPAIA